MALTTLAKDYGTNQWQEVEMVHPHGAADSAATMLSLPQITTAYATNKGTISLLNSTELAPSAFFVVPPPSHLP
nr:hypothetical protein Iba_chr07aCG11960 [Ipomoea batatas]